MRFAAPIVGAVFCIGAGFCLGRLSLGQRSTVAASEDPSANVREEIGGLKAAIAGMQLSVERLSSRVADPPPAQGVAAVLANRTASVQATGAASCACPRQTSAEVMEEEPDPTHPRVREVEALIAASLSRGTWTESDVARFRELASAAPDQNWVPLMQKIDGQINAGRLRPAPDLIDFH